MRIAGIISEYDPFHAGHAAHIAATREAGATHIITVMSGAFTQRGEPAAVDKFTRARMALAGGADLVIELPLPWVLASAETFAVGGVSLLQAFGNVQTLSFGSECGDIVALSRVAAALDELDKPENTDKWRSVMADGLSYAAARQKAVAALIGEDAALLDDPNNTLGVEYIRAIRRWNAELAPFTVRRVGAGHDQTAAPGETASGSQLRKLLRAGELETVLSFLSPATTEILRAAVADGHAPADPACLHTALLARLRCMSEEELAVLPGVSEGLEHRLYRAIRESGTYEELITAAKTRRYAESRLRRTLWAALPGLERTHSAGMPPYLRILGMNDRGREILSAASPTLPLLTRAEDALVLTGTAKTVFALEQRATDLQALAMPCPIPCGTDLTMKLCKGE